VPRPVFENHLVRNIFNHESHDPTWCGLGRYAHQHQPSGDSCQSVTTWTCQVPPSHYEEGPPSLTSRKPLSIRSYSCTGHRFEQVKWNETGLMVKFMGWWAGEFVSISFHGMSPLGVSSIYAVSYFLKARAGPLLDIFQLVTGCMGCWRLL